MILVGDTSNAAFTLETRAWIFQESVQLNYKMPKFSLIKVSFCCYNCEIVLELALTRTLSNSNMINSIISSRLTQWLTFDSF